MTKLRKPDRRSEDRTARILAALAEKPMTGVELAAKLFISKASLMRYLRRLMAEPRKVRVVDHRHSGMQWAYVYGLGFEENAPAPKAETRAERWAKELAKMRADPDLRDLYLSRQRAWRRASAAAKKPHGWASALMGPAKQGRAHADA